MTNDRPPWRVKHDGTCARCGRALLKGEPAVYERSTRTIRCVACPEVEGELRPPPAETIDAGVAGGSARSEYERRRAKREDRIKARVGRRVGGVILALTDDPQSTRAWARGAEGEERLAEAIAGLDGVVALHDRGAPGTRGNIDHVVIAPAGIFVVDAKRYSGVIRIRDRGPLLQRDDRLYVGGRDCSKLADGLVWQVEAVRQALATSRLDGDIPVMPVLCFIGAEWPLLRPPTAFRGVLLEGPRTLRKRLVERSIVSPSDVQRLGAILAAGLPAKSARD